ncbi:hypothetical protein [Yinghuangia seranimata]|uniref:hypothetical protein n=1 Tax=Yinghuangia seranimata TaxID=408067 RepID=UPI00248AC2A0|nr:hypothetical protein [Yinghuangia seranimata]MDI2124554.1 hypothetical protein [Yinghuangia seranimata]
MFSALLATLFVLAVVARVWGTWRLSVRNLAAETPPVPESAEVAEYREWVAAGRTLRTGRGA